MSEAENLMARLQWPKVLSLSNLRNLYIIMAFQQAIGLYQTSYS